MNRFSNILIKIIILIAVTAFISYSIYDAYPGLSLGKIAYVVAIGFDTAENNNFKMTIQIAKPNAANLDSSGSSQSTQTVLNSVECSSFESGLNLLNSYISRDINLAHCDAIIISEELASKGISQIIYDLSNNAEVSSHANVIVTKCRALDCLKLASPVLESFAARYYHVIPTSSEYTGSTVSVPLIDFFNYMEDNCRQPIGALGNINTDSTHLIDSNSKFVANKDISYFAGESPITSSNKVEVMGIAIFKKGQLVGELNGLDCICHKIVSGTLNYCNMQVPNPNDNAKNINLILRLKGKPKIHLNIINGSAYIKADINLSIRVISIEKGSDFTNGETGKILQDTVNLYMENIISDYLYKTAKNLNSDIDGFGYYALKHFSTIDDFNSFNWLDNYQNSFFSVAVNGKIMAGNTFLGI